MREDESWIHAPPVQAVLSMFAVLVAVAAFKVVMAPPERRATEVCYPTYKVVEFTRVTLVQAFAPDEPGQAIAGINASRRYYHDCKRTLSGLPGFQR